MATATRDTESHGRSALTPSGAAARAATTGSTAAGGAGSTIPTLTDLPAELLAPTSFVTDHTRRSVEVASGPAPPVLGSHALDPVASFKQLSFPLARASSAPSSTTEGHPASIQHVHSLPLKTGLVAAAPRILGQQTVVDLHRGAALVTPTGLFSPTKPPAIRLERPLLVPALPYTLTPYTVAVDCRIDEVASRVQSALRAGNVDYEYNSDKWKAKCYLFKPTGHCQFVIRMYSERAGADHFLVECQRRAGCARLFRRAFDSLVSSFAQSGVINPDSDAAKRAQMLGLYGRVPTPSSSEATSVAHPPELSIDADDHGADVGGDDGPTGAGGGAPLTTAEAHSIVDAFRPLGQMLASPYDDIVTPAAESIAALSASARVVTAFVMRLRAGRDSATRATSAAVSSPASASAPSTAAAAPASSPTSASASTLPVPSSAVAGVRQSSVGSVASVSSTVTTSMALDADRADASVVLTLLQALVHRSTLVEVSLEARTASAMALANFARDAYLVETLVMLKAHVAITQSIAVAAISARGAALRRELLQVIGAMIQSHNGVAIALVTSRFQQAFHAFAVDPRYHGYDPAFDRLAELIDTQLNAAAARIAAATATSTSSSSSSASSSTAPATGSA